MDLLFFNKELKESTVYTASQLLQTLQHSTPWAGRGGKQDCNFDDPTDSRAFQQAMKAQSRMLGPSSQPTS